MRRQYLMPVIILITLMMVVIISFHPALLNSAHALGKDATPSATDFLSSLSASLSKVSTAVTPSVGLN